MEKLVELVKVNFKNWTSLCFLLPLALALYYGLYIYSVVLALVVFSSFMYHSTGDYRYRFLDHLSAYLLIACSLFYGWLGNFSFATFATLVFFIVCSLYFKFKKPRNEREYIYNHGYWHIVSSFITIYCVVTYLLVVYLDLGH